MNLVFRYVEAIDDVLLLNKSDKNIYVSGTCLSPGISIVVSSSVAHTLKSMIDNDYVEIISLNLLNEKVT